MNASRRGRARRLRSMAAATAVLLAAEAAVLIESTGQTVAVGRSAAASTGADAKGLGPAEAQNQASALLTARLQQRQIEVLDARTDASQTFANPDGTLTLSASAEPVRVQRDGQWVSLDATLKVSGSGAVVPTQSESALVLSGGGTGPLTRIFYAGAGAALTSPSTGDRPARRVNLTAQGLTTYTGATYQYRLGETDSWHNVPAADVRKNADGTTLAVWPVPLTAGAPAPLTWNIADTLAEDSPVDLRVLFTHGTATAGSPASTVTLDRNAGTAQPVVHLSPRRPSRAVRRLLVLQGKRSPA